jgi:hypothetical protein
MTTVVNQWRIYCITEGCFVTGYLPSSATCSTCFNNTTHTVNSGSISIISTITPNTTLVSTQAPNETNGNFTCERKSITATPNTITTDNTTFNYNVGILSFHFDVKNENIGDSFELLVQPITNIGILASAISSGSSIITLPPTVMAYMFPGFELIFTNSSSGSSTIEGEIVSVNTTNNSVTLSNPLTTSYNTGDYICFRSYKIKNFIMGISQAYQIGNYLRASHFPYGMKAVLNYTNNSSSSKTFVYGCDYLF